MKPVRRPKVRADADPAAVVVEAALAKTGEVEAAAEAAEDINKL